MNNFGQSDNPTVIYIKIKLLHGTNYVTDVCDSEDEEYVECSNMCSTITCKDFRLSHLCDEAEDVECVPGCLCKDGMVRDNTGKCIRQEDCPCYREQDGTIVPFGATEPGSSPCEIWSVSKETRKTIYFYC